MDKRWALVALTVLLGLPAARADEAGEALIKQVSAAYQAAGTYQGRVTVEVKRASQAGRPAIPPAVYELSNALDRATSRLKVDVRYGSAAGPMRTLIVRDGATLSGRADRLRAVAGADGTRRAEPYARHVAGLPFAGEMTFELLSSILPGVIGPGLAVDVEALLTGDARTAIGANPEAELTALPPDADGRPGVRFLGWNGAAEITARFDPASHALRALRLTAADPTKFGGVESLTYTYAEAGFGLPFADGVFALDTAGSEPAAAPAEVFSTAAPRLMEGGPAPAFELKNLAGETVKLSEIPEEVIILDFWATWCPPCREGLPALQGLQDWAKAGGHSLGIYCVNVREDAAKVEPFWAEHKLSMNVLYDTDGATGQRYGAAGIPTTVVIADGVIQLTQVGYQAGVEERLKAKVEELLAGRR